MRWLTWIWRARRPTKRYVEHWQFPSEDTHDWPVYEFPQPNQLSSESKDSQG